MEVSCLPEELLEHILSYLSVVCELQTSSQVCLQWRKICVSIYRLKHSLFLDQAQKGNFVWRQCGEVKRARSLHFVPKHVKPRNSAQQLGMPAPRSFHHAAFHGQYIYVYGGESGGTALASSSYFNDMFRYNVLLQSWEKVSTTGTPPTPRSKVSVTRVEDTLIVTGGCVSTRLRTSIRPAEIVHDDVHFFDIGRSLWYKSPGSLLNIRCYHESICLGDSTKLVLSGGFSSVVDMCDAIEVCNLKRDLNSGLYAVSESRRFQFQHLRIFHSQVKIDEQTLLIYGGMTQAPDLTSQHLIRTDACLIKFNDNFSDFQLTSIVVNNWDVYNGLYPAFVNDFARVQNSLIFFQRSGYIKKVPDHGQNLNFYEADTIRKPTGDEIYRQDYYHTFILNFDGILENNSISWMPVTKNPPLLAPRYSIFHRTILVGDGIYVFGGTVLDQRSKQPSSSNNLYKITVMKGPAQ